MQSRIPTLLSFGTVSDTRYQSNKPLSVCHFVSSRRALFCHLKLQVRVGLLLAAPPQERQNRDKFRQLLQKHRDEGIIAVRLRWKEYEPHVEDTEEYQAVVKNTTGSRPRELFDDLIIELEDEYDKARPLMKEALKESGWSATPDSTYLSFIEALDSQAAKAAGVEKGELDVAAILSALHRSS